MAAVEAVPIKKARLMDTARAAKGTCRHYARDWRSRPGGSCRGDHAGPVRAAPQREVTDATFTVAPTVAGGLIGTVPYMAPEQLEGASVDARTDIFAFGSLLFEMATGRRAFGGTSTASQVAAILGDTRPQASAARPDLPQIGRLGTAEIRASEPLVRPYATPPDRPAKTASCWPGAWLPKP